MSLSMIVVHTETLQISLFLTSSYLITIIQIIRNLRYASILYCK